MLEVDGLAALVLLGLWIYCIFDVIATDTAAVRNLPKGIWLIIVLVLPDIGSVAWLVLGRPARAGWRPGDSEPRRMIARGRPSRPIGPEDSADFIARIEARDRMLAAWAEEDRLKSLERQSGSIAGDQERRRLEEWEADLTRREAELRGEEKPPVEPDA